MRKIELFARTLRIASILAVALTLAAVFVSSPEKWWHLLLWVVSFAAFIFVELLLTAIKSPRSLWDAYLTAPLWLSTAIWPSPLFFGIIVSTIVVSRLVPPGRLSWVGALFLGCGVAATKGIVDPSLWTSGGVLHFFNFDLFDLDCFVIVVCLSARATLPPQLLVLEPKP